MAQLPCIVLVYHGPLLSHLWTVRHAIFFYNCALEFCSFDAWNKYTILSQMLVKNGDESHGTIRLKQKHPTNISKFRNLEIVPSSPDAPFQAPTSGYLFPLDFCAIAREFCSFLEPTEQQKR